MNAKQIADDIGWGRIIMFVIRDCPFMGLVFYVAHVAQQRLPEIDAMIRRGYEENARVLKEAADKYAEAAERRDSTMRAILERFREDEAEDRRLFVEILKRSDLSSEQLTEAFSAAGLDDSRKTRADTAN